MVLWSPVEEVMKRYWCAIRARVRVKVGGDDMSVVGTRAKHI
jgi:hypothetical protein